MGKHERQKNLFSYGVDLDKRVRLDHPLRKVDEQVDFSFVREEVADKYGSNGNVSVDPEVVLKLMFLLFWDNVRSERELMRILPERLDYLWFLGYGLDDAIPDHSVLSKARARWGADAFEKMFLRSVSQCVEARLVSNELLHMDGSLIDANASRDSVVKSDPEMIARLREVYGAQEAKLEGCKSDSSKGRLANATLISPTDPDAPCARKKTGGESKPRYKAHRAVDDEHGVVTATITSPGDVEENAKMLALLHQHRANVGGLPQSAVADSQYGTSENYRDFVALGVATHMKPHSGRKRHVEVYGAERFRYDAASDTYACPAGERLYPRSPDKIRMSVEYAVRKGTCDRCSLRPQCTKAKLGRTVQRRWGQELIDQGLEQSRSEPAHRSRARRKWRMEGSFAQSANLHGFKRSRWRRLWRQRIQDHIICAIENVKILIANASGPRKSPAVVISRVQGPAITAFARIARVAISILEALSKSAGGDAKRPEIQFRALYPLFGQQPLYL
ncbi:IS1182 family transposase [Pelagicoccus sp. SDUM812003]|nr:IS1182 family transposase [Pelagicoccus sp. SDUM812003]